MLLKRFEECIEDEHISVEQLLKEACSVLGIPYTLAQRKPDIVEFWVTCNLPAWVFGVEEKENE